MKRAAFEVDVLRLSPKHLALAQSTAPPIQLEAARYGKPPAAGGDVGDERVEGSAQLLPLAVEDGDASASQFVPVRSPLAVPDAQRQHRKAVDDGGEGLGVQRHVGAVRVRQRAEDLVG